MRLAVVSPLPSLTLIAYIDLNSFDPSIGFKLRDRVLKNARTIRTIIEGRLLQASGFIVRCRASFVLCESLTCSNARLQGQIGELVGDIKNLIMPNRGQGIVMSDAAREFYHRVIRTTDRPVSEVAGVILIGAVRVVTSVSREGAGSLFLLTDLLTGS